ncbi:MAG: stage V sporulation protein D, partial [Clostridia bacterium]|nr:stage V sporulation protein D [Clostridia bacterium]
MANGIPAKQKKRMKQVMLIFLLICLPVLVFSIFNISVINHEKYESMAINQQTSDSVINARRGTILDRSGNELAVSATAETVTINPKAINKKDDTEAVAIAKGLSEILGLDYDSVYKKTQANTFYQLIKRTVTEEEAKAVRELKIELDTDAIILVEDTKRYYPNGSLASTVIGFCNVDGDGIEGIEAYYNDVLKGTSGRVVTAKDAVGSELPYEYETYVESEDGYDLVLTIDSTIQYYTDKYLEQALVDSKVMNKAAAIVMDVNTGEILAMSTKPDYDLNSPRTITDETELAYLETLSGEEYSAAQLQAWQKMWRNKAISDTYEPGSVFKVITSAMALEDGTVSLSNSFDCAGRTVVNGTTIKCWKTAGHGHQSFQEALDNSCNCAFMAISSQIGSPSFYNYMTAFGFREK